MAPRRLYGLLAVPRQALPYFWPESAIERVALVAALVWGATLRLKFLLEPIRFDEASNALYYADRSFVYALGGGAGNDNHALNSVLMWFSARLFGWSEATIRLPALVFGVLFIWFMFAFLRWYSGDGAIAATGAMAVAVSPWLIYFSVNGRGYIHQAAILALLTPVVLAGLRGTGDWFALGIWAGALSTLGAFAVRSMILFAGALLLGSGLGLLDSLLLSGGFGGARHERAGSGAIQFIAVWIGFMVLTAAVVFGPVAAFKGVPFLRGGLAGYGRQPLGIALHTTVESFQAALTLLLASSHRWVPWAGSAFFVAGTIALWRRGRLLLLLLIGLLLCGLLATLILHFGLKPRFLPAAMVLVIPFLSYGLGMVFGHRFRWAAPAMLAAYAVFLMNPDVFRSIHDTGHIPEARSLAKEVIARRDLGTSLVLAPPLWDNAMAFYFRQSNVPYDNVAGPGLAKLTPARLCTFEQVLVFVPMGEHVDEALMRFQEARWYPRLNRERLSQEPLSRPWGQMIRIPLGGCAT